MILHHEHSGRASAHMLSGTVEDTPLLFLDKQTIEVTVVDALVQGKDGIVSGYCEVYPTNGIITNVCRYVCVHIYVRVYVCTYVCLNYARM